MKYTLISLLPLLLSFMVLSCDRNIPGNQGPEDQGGISGDTVDFSITLTDITSTGVTGTIIPSDSLMTYLAMIVEQESVSGLTDEEWFESDIAWMTQMAATLNTTLHDYIETFRLLRGETFVEEDNLQPGTDYYLYAYGLDNSGTAPAMTTPITKAPFTTTVPEPSDEGITIEVYVSGTDASAAAAPYDNSLLYAFDWISDGILAGFGYTEGTIEERIVDYTYGWWSQYIAAGLYSIEQLAYKGPASVSFSIDDPDDSYYVFAYFVNEEGEQTSEVWLEHVTAEE